MVSGTFWIRVVASVASLYQGPAHLDYARANTSHYAVC